MNHEYSQRLERIEEILAENLPEPETGSYTRTLVEPCRELFLRGGKRWRPLLLVLTCELYGGGDRGYLLTPAVEFIHTASLIHDDIEDGADTRRGAPAVHILYGIDTAINSGSWLFFEALSCINSFPCAPETAVRLYRAAAEEARRLHLGQAMDIAWHRDNSRVPSAAEYLSMTRLKTGTLASLAGRFGVLGAGGTEAAAEQFGEIAAGAGIGFQVLDDVLNLTRGNPGKKRGDDIVEGKKSLPVLFHLDRRPEDFRRIAGYFEAAKLHGLDAPEVEQCVTLLNESGAVERARQYGEGLIRSVCGTLRERWPEHEAARLIAGMFEAMIGEAAG